MTAPPAPFFYRAFGLTVQADIALPELISAPRGPADIAIALVEILPEPPTTLSRLGETVRANATEFRIDVPAVGHFRVSDGQWIEVMAVSGYDPAELRAYLLGTCIGVALLQRGMVPLHASAIDIGGRAVAFTGMSGAGKSTLALHLQRRGHAVLCDDLCGIGSDLAVFPGVVRLKLWHASLADAGHDVTGLERVMPGADKFHFPPDAPAIDRAVPLAAIVTLDWSEKDAVAVERLKGAQAVREVVRNTFRGVLVDPMGIAAAHLARCTAIARAVPILRLSRPHRFDTLDAAVDAVIAALK